MSDAPRCEPPEELRGQDGWHWLERDAPAAACVAVQWSTHYAWWGFRSGTQYADRAAKEGWRYLSPVLTPAEVATLRAERDAAVARVALLEGAIREAADALEGVAECTSDKRHSDACRRACEIASAWASEASDSARAALSPTTATTQPSELRDGDHPV